MAMVAARFDPASYRDRRGRVLDLDGRILRVIAADAAEDVAWLEREGLLADLVASRRLIPTWRTEAPADVSDGFEATVTLEHERLPFISYPYEWPFSALKAAALFHLDLHQDLLSRGASLLDASAYNVQFRGPRPIMIDVLSLRPYREGEYWLGHQQFLDQFLNPLLLRALLGVPPHGLYRGALEGVPTALLARLLPLRHKLRPGVFFNVVLPARLQRLAAKERVDAARAMRHRRLPKRSYLAMLAGLRRTIAKLEARPDSVSSWRDYPTTCSYEVAEVESKRRFVAEYAERMRPRLMLDLGCNTGTYAAVALAAGAAEVIGVENDPDAADQAFRQAEKERLDFLPLVIDAVDPSPAQGWRHLERRSFAARARFDGMIALAFAHHLAIGRNIPFDQLVAWLVGLAPHGVIEFVPKSDPQVQRLLRLRDDIFSDYSQENFAALLGRFAGIVRQETISASGRVLYWYERPAPPSSRAGTS
jgi:ribosomal protein L11 methylase PrmA